MLMTPRIGPKKTLTCTLATASYTTDGATIPSTDSTRWGRTLVQNDFPVWSFQPEYIKYIGKISVIVFNNSGSSQTISWKMYKNGSQVNTGSKSVSNSNYCSFISNFYNVSVGDVIELAVWCSTTSGITIHGYIYHVLPTRLLPTSKTCIDVSYTYGIYTYPAALSSGYTNFTNQHIGANITTFPSSAATYIFTGINFVSTGGYGMYRFGEGDVESSNSTSTQVSTTTKYAGNAYYITSATYRELRL